MRGVERLDPFEIWMLQVHSRRRSQAAPPNRLVPVCCSLWLRPKFVRTDATEPSKLGPPAGHAVSHAPGNQHVSQSGILRRPATRRAGYASTPSETLAQQ